jgi:hypothetical protein
MKRHLPIIALIFATNVAFADAQTAASSVPADAQAQAAALLSRPHALGTAKIDSRSLSSLSVSERADAHESAAALLSGARPGHRVSTVSAHAELPPARAAKDAQAQAAALLSGSRSAPTDSGENTFGRAL